jgi:hypothetical protein
MSGFVEQSADGSVLEWRPHDLAGVATLRGLPELEPRLLTGERASEGFLPLAADLRGLRWDLSGWEALEITPADGAAPVVRRKTAPPAVTWQELGNPGAVEVTPRRADGTPGITRRIERPRPRVRFLPAEEILIVRVEGAEEPTCVQVELFEPGDYPQLHATGDGQALIRRGDALEATLDLGYGFFGVIAVVESIASRRRLLDWRSWVEGRLLGRNDATIAANLRRKVEQTLALAGTLRSFAAWPLRSRERLAWLADRAGWLTETTSDTAGLGHLTGVFRAVFLAELGVVAEKPSPDSARRLSEGAFLAALGRLRPTLANRLRDAKDDESRLRILQPGEETPPSGLGPLGRTQTAAGWAARLNGLALQLRDGCPEARTIAALHEVLQRHVEAAEPLGAAPAEITRLEQRLVREAGRPPVPDNPPPLTREAYAKWEEVRSARADWRRGLARVLAYCETGDWLAVVAASVDGTSSPSFDLQRRLALLDPPPPPRQADAEIASLVCQEIDRLEAEEEAETDRDLRRSALNRLRSIVRPQAGDWAGLRCGLAESERLRPDHPWLAAELPALEASAPLAERGAVARRFLAVCDEIARRTAAWDQVDPRWRALFKAPDERGFLDLLQEIREMQESLGPDAVAAEPALMAGLPASPSPQLEAILETRWRYLERLLPLQEEVARRFAAQYRDWESFAGLLEPYQLVVRFWCSRPQAERPHYFAQLADLTDRASGGGATRPLAVRSLVELLKAQPSIRQEWQHAEAQSAIAERTAARATTQPQPGTERRAFERNS